jgi:GNAT superfamily N-acetyltransferase
MAEGYRIAYEDNPEEAALTTIGFGIKSYNEQQAGDSAYRRLCCLLYAPDQMVVGGLIGATYWDWFYVDLLWIKEEVRGLGYGHQLLTLAEREARQRGAKNAYLDTFSFQAPDFYRQHGYAVFGELCEFPQGHQRYFLRKRLQ